LASSWSSSADYAGFWQRAAATAIDALVVLVILVPLAVLGFGLRRVSLDPAALAWDLIALAAIAVAVVGFWHFYGATPGKSTLALKIVDARDGGPPGILQLVVRLIAYAVSALPLYLGFLWIAVDRRKQGWHDKIARTVVIQTEE